MAHRLLIALALLATNASAADWSTWRGPNRDGIVTGFTAPATWPKYLRREWHVPVGTGYSSPVQEGERVFLHTREGNDEHVLCLELSTGAIHWQSDYPAAGSVHPAGAAHGIGPKSTPSIADGRLYTLGIGSILSCFDTASGRVLWRKDFATRFPKPAPSCGTSMSPLLANGMCIVHVGVDRAGELIAFDAATGERRWTYDGDGPGYGSPVLATIDGNPQLIVPVSKFIAGFNPASGKLLWRHPFPTKSTQNILTPVIHDDRLIVGGIAQNTACLLPATGDSTAQPKTLWTNPLTPMHMSSSVLHGKTLFGMSPRKGGQLFCLDALTGNTLWMSEGGLGQNVVLLTTDSLLVLLTSGGELIFADPDAGEYKPLATYPVSDNRTWAHPLLTGSRILIKDETHLTCWTTAR